MAKKNLNTLRFVRRAVGLGGGLRGRVLPGSCGWRMTRITRTGFARKILLLGCLLSAVSVRGEAMDLFDGFHPDWREAWKTQGFTFIRATDYRVVAEGPADRLVLRADAADANRALLREIKVKDPSMLRLSWRWKVAAPLTHKGEREKGGDDYAARVFVVFERSTVPTRTVAINYVWAAHEPVGSEYTSPYTDRVRMIVLRSGADEAGEWREESRDVLRDYEAAFGRAAREFNGVAVMVDTDNTDSKAVAWFEALKLEIKPGAGDSKLTTRRD